MVLRINYLYKGAISESSLQAELHYKFVLYLKLQIDIIYSNRINNERTGHDSITTIAQYSVECICNNLQLEKCDC